MENIFNVAVSRAQMQATNFGGSCVSGTKAVKGAADRLAPRNITLGMFADGDVVEIPAYPVEGNPQETDAQWLSKPLSRGGDPVLSVLCKVTTKSGAVVCKELFAGTLVKSAVNNATMEAVSASGSVPADLASMDTLEALYQAVAGKKIKFSNPKTFRTTRRDFTGTRPDREANTTVFQIDWA